MKTVQNEQYTKLSRALYNLEDILACMGVKEFSLSRDRHNLKIDTNADNIDTDLLISFCKNIEQIHDTKFGAGHAAIAC
jgi:two-component SAPR family response regulator